MRPLASAVAPASARLFSNDRIAFTRYTWTAEGAYLAYLAYQVTGDGPIDVVLPITGSAAVELIWEEPAVSGFVSRLTSFARLITFDPQGFGSSGRLKADAVPAIQTWRDRHGCRQFRTSGSSFVGREHWSDEVLCGHPSGNGQ